MRSARVRFEEAAAQAQLLEESTNLLDVLQIDDASSINETKMEASFMSEGNINRYNFIGRTPHAKVIEAEESKKRFKELTKLMTMQPLTQTPVRISVPISDISPQSDISMSPALANQSNCSFTTPGDVGNIMVGSVELANQSRVDTSTRGIAMDNSTPMVDRSQQSLPTPNSAGSNMSSSDASFNIVEALGQENENISVSGAMSVSVPSDAPSQPSPVMCTPSTIVGSVHSSISKSAKETRTPFSDISNRSVPALNQRESDKLEPEFGMSIQKNMMNKSVSFHSSHVMNSAGKGKKSKAPVTPYVKIECSESEDGESDIDCNTIIVSQMQCPSSTEKNSFIEKKLLFVNSVEKQKPSPGDIKSPAYEASNTSTSMGIASIPVQRKVKDESRNWHGGLDLAKETMPTAEMIQTQYIILPAPRPETQDVATMYSPMTLSIPPSPMVGTNTATNVPVMVTFSPVTSHSIATSPLPMNMPVNVVEVNPVSVPQNAAATNAPVHQVGFPPIPPATSSVVPMRTSVVVAPTATHSNTQQLPHANNMMLSSNITRLGRPISVADTESGVSFGRGPSASSLQSKRIDTYKKAETMVPPVETRMIVEVEKPVVSVCTANLHPSKAYYSPNNTRKVQQMLAENVQHLMINNQQSHQLYKSNHSVTVAEHPSIVSVMDISYQHVRDPNHSMLSFQHLSVPHLATSDATRPVSLTPVKANNAMKTEQMEKIIMVSPAKSVSTLGEYPHDLSSIRAMDVSIQVDSTMFSRKKTDSDSSVHKSAQKNISVGDSATHTPSSMQTDPLSQSVLLKSATKSSSGIFNESVLSHSSSYYYASGEGDDTGTITEKSFILADFLPRTAVTNGFGKGLFPEESKKIGGYNVNAIVPTSLANPWVYRMGFDARECSLVSSEFSTAATKASAMVSSIGSKSMLLRSAGSLGKALRVVEDDNKKKRLIDQWNVSYYQDEDEEEETTRRSPEKDVMFDDELEQRYAAASYGSRGIASTVTIDRTLNNQYQYPSALDLTLRSDIAVANFTRQPLATSQQLDDDLSHSFMTSGADTTFTLDQSYMTKTTLLSHDEVIPRFAIKSLKRSSDEAFEVKEINFETAPGECTTVMMVFDNNRPHAVTLKAQTALVRVEPMLYHRAADQETWDNIAEQLLKDDKNEEFFSVSPGEVTIPAGKESSLFITFAPPVGMEGIFSGAMRIKHEKKAYTMLLRGECAMRHSVQSTPMAASHANNTDGGISRTRIIVPEQIEIGANTAVEVSQFPNQSHMSWHTKTSSVAANTCAAAAAGVSSTALELSSVISPALASSNSQQPMQQPMTGKSNKNHHNSTISALFSSCSIAEESIMFPLQEPQAQQCEISPTSLAFQNRLRELQERIAEISRKVVWKQEQSPSHPQFSLAASEATSVGLQVQPELLKVEGNLNEYQTITLSNPQSNRTMIVKLYTTHDCLHVSTNLVSISPESEVKLLLKIDRSILLNIFGESMYKASLASDGVLDSWHCGTVVMQYDSDLEVSIPVVLDESNVRVISQVYELLQLQQQQQQQVVTSVVSTPATAAQSLFQSTLKNEKFVSHTPAAGTLDTPNRQQQIMMMLNASDYHHQLQYDENSDANIVHNSVKSVKSAKSNTIQKNIQSFQKPPLQPVSLTMFQQRSVTSSRGRKTQQQHHQHSDTVSVASTISSHTHLTHQQQQNKEKHVRQNSFTSAASSVVSSSSVVSETNLVKAMTNAITTTTTTTSMLSVPDLSLTSNVSTMTGTNKANSKKVTNGERMHISSGSRRGLYFENPTAMFGSVMVGSLVRTRIILANATNHETVVYLGDPDLPFVLHKNEIRLKPRSFARVPVRFVPVTAGHYEAELMAQSANGQEVASIKLTGHAYV